MNQDARSTAIQSLREATDLLEAEKSRPTLPLEKLGAALERVSTAIQTPEKQDEDEHAPSRFAPPPRTTGERLAAFAVACVNMVAALGLILVLLVLAFGKADTTVELSLETQVKFKSAPAQSEPAHKSGNGNG